ncbi:hypothetical protein PNEG_01500 [Pneumocystis murina B123]|uniref:CTLH domain-containing protein n=1 Tax=Pneumocystis murina (strain B123) TaxID=1069680 RepID=M7NNG1_PNEMU|nr:hypothetical protein PNEG_01500 [Pneumocystis murina B123]EMR10228.1 hypothetical protein PNEG_01500 [Pneumocystis murina B123]
MKQEKINSDSNSNLSLKNDIGNQIDNDFVISDIHDEKKELLKNHPIEKEEIIRLILQTLKDFGYKSSVSHLEQESGFSVESTHVLQFRKSILTGDWKHAEELLSFLYINEEVPTNILFYLRQQKFLELLEEKKMPEALSVLREELSPLDYNKERLHFLTSLIMSSSVNDLKRRASWDGANGISRQKLLKQISKYISPTLMIPEKRLINLLIQAKNYQISQCLYHTDSNFSSLLSDHHCEKDQFPNTVIKVLRDHTDEVWCTRFSHNGKYLASASKDSTAIIWNLQTYEPLYILKEHEKPVIYVDWSPNDELILTCGQDHMAKLWEVKSGTCIKTITHHKDFVTSCSWLPDGSGFITASLDMEVILWNIDGIIIHQWKGSRVYDLAVTPDGKKFIAGGTEKMLHVYNLLNRTLEFSFLMQSDLTCVSISKDSKFAIINVSSQEVYLWDLEKMQVVKKYAGQHQGNYIIRSCFGGAQENFILSGSEDSQVYVWHRENGSLIETLKSHKGTVNSVSWSPINPVMFASAGDDHTVRIWAKSSTLSKDKVYDDILLD